MPAVAQSVGRRVDSLRAAVADLLVQEFDWSTGHLATILSGCAFAPSLLTFWFVNGVLDFSTAVAIGSIQGPGGLVVRLLAYLLLVPAFLLLRVTYYLVHPVHRRTVLSGACPQSDLLSLDWFSVGILATGLPLALADFGPWLGMNAVFLVGIFLLPRAMAGERRRNGTKFLAIALGGLVFAYASYGAAVASVTPLPHPAAVLGPVATLTLAPATDSGSEPTTTRQASTATPRRITRPPLSVVSVCRSDRSGGSCYRGPLPCGPVRPGQC